MLTKALHPGATDYARRGSEVSRSTSGGAEYRAAGRSLRRKYPVLHGVLVPLTHRLVRRRTGRTVHFELTG
ncbi:hypothetical protein [Micromonospora coerulea]|uniref:hypothetical protein n=1 Tax=Micromonospora coerulea TaxID=47856 RepID=UPI001903AB67|nr:hypothetical protein [Micromonospora veneta]